MKNRYNLIIIGAGPAGTPIAIESAKLNSTKSIALIDTIHPHPKIRKINLISY